MAKKTTDNGPDFKIKKTKDYITLTLGGQNMGEVPEKLSDTKAITTLVELLMNKEELHLKQDALKELKSETGKELLLKAIAVSKSKEHTKVLTAACWEAGLDFSKYVSFFVQLALISDMDICIEALTVIEDMQGPMDLEVVKACIKKIEAARSEDQSEKSILLADILLSLQRFTS
jgi:hypothetical protein